MSTNFHVIRKFKVKIKLCYESSTTTSQELSRPILHFLQSLSACEGSVSSDQISVFFNILRHARLILPKCPGAIKNKPVPLYTDSVPPSTNHCCTKLYTASSSRDAQLSQVGLVIIVVTAGILFKSRAISDWRHSLD